MDKKLKLKHYKKYNKFVLENTTPEERFVVERYFEDSQDGGLFICLLYDFKKHYSDSELKHSSLQDMILSIGPTSVYSKYYENVLNFFKK